MGSEYPACEETGRQTFGGRRVTEWGFQKIWVEEPASKVRGLWQGEEWGLEEHRPSWVSRKDGGGTPGAEGRRWAG